MSAQTGFADGNISVYVTSHAKGTSSSQTVIENGTKLKELFAKMEGSGADPKNYSITVNGQANQAGGLVLRSGDRVAFSPVNVKGA